MVLELRNSAYQFLKELTSQLVKMPWLNILDITFTYFFVKCIVKCIKNLESFFKKQVFIS